MNRGTLLGVEGSVDGDTYDVQKGAGYGVATELTVEGTPSEKSIMDGVWDSIEESGDLPVYVQARLTWAGHEWPWTKVVSKFDVKYQAVHMAEGTFLGALFAWTLLNLPVVISFILVLLKVAVVVYVILKLEDVAQFIKEYAPEVAVGLGAGVVLLAAVILMGDDKK